MDKKDNDIKGYYDCDVCERESPVYSVIGLGFYWQCPVERCSGWGTIERKDLKRVVE